MSLPDPTTEKPEKNYSWIAGALFMLFGGAALAITFYFHNQQKASQNWPSVEGIVVVSFLEEYVDDEQQTSYTPRVKYEFTVDGQRYGSQQVRFGIEQSYGFPNVARKHIENYPVGQGVTVYYDPAEPTSAVLDRSTTKITPWYIGAGSVTVLGFIVLIASFRRKE